MDGRLTREDIICVPAAIAFGFSESTDSAASLGRLFCEGSYSMSEEVGRKEAVSITRLQKNEYGAILFAPLHRATFEPDTVAFYGNPAQLMRMVHAWTYRQGERVKGHFGGKIECTEYLLAPFKDMAPHIAMPGTGDRAFSMTQDDEIVFSLPGKYLKEIHQALQEAGKKSALSILCLSILTSSRNFPSSSKNSERIGHFLGVNKTGIFCEG